MRKTLLATSLLAAAVAAPSAYAHQAGDILVRAGAVHVSTHESSSKIKVNGSAVPGSKATLNNDTQLGLNFAYMVTDNIGVELLAATPFKHDVKVKGVGPDFKLGTIKHLPPTLSAVYYPMASGSAFQPYVGAGINYTWFFDEKVSSGAKADGFRNLSLKNSWGLAAQVGADYMLTDNIMINGQIRYIDIDTTASVNLGPNKVKVDVDVKPWVYMVGVGYKF
ncbi:MAG: outer membrane beta-barrel protein [Thiopseudomonas sp.]|nr:outer membrane beta-barrel protein [Thiopseudomonas sp.]MCK9465672.1 outer membrane beta-barrel protein [Thiopseudomonas sp.]